LTKAARTDLTGLIQSGQLPGGAADVAGFNHAVETLKRSKIDEVFPVALVDWRVNSPVAG